MLKTKSTEEQRKIWRNNLKTLHEMCVCVIRSFLFDSTRQISHTISNHSIFYRTYESHVMRNFSIMWQSFQFYKMLQREASFCTHAHTLTHNAHVLTYFDVVYSMDLIWFFFFKFNRKSKKSITKHENYTSNLKPILVKKIMNTIEMRKINGIFLVWIVFWS